MHGYFELGITGSQEEIIALFHRAKKNKVLASWFSREIAQVKKGDYTIEKLGLKKFLDRYKLVQENGGTGNISTLEWIADSIANIAPELEVLLLLQDMDCTMVWNVTYSPSGTNKTYTGLLEKEGTDWETFKDIPNCLSLDMKEVLAYAQMCRCDLSPEVITYYLDSLYHRESGNPPEGYDEEDGELHISMGELMEEYFSDKYHDAPYHINGRGLPSLEYIARLFAGGYGGLSLEIPD